MEETKILLETGTNELEILEFFINETTPDSPVPTPNYFGINVAKVMQVIEAPQLTHPESAPNPMFLGTIPLRHHILPVLDLSVWLGMRKVQSVHDVVIVTEFSSAVTGFLVSGVTEIHRVGWPEVIPPSGLVSRTTDSIVGLVDRGGHFIQLLDLETLISSIRQERQDAQPQVKARQAYRALVADDSATIRFMVKESLANANFEPRMTSNGKEALDVLLQIKEQARREGKRIKDFLDVVISDIEMPLMDGFTLTKHVKEDPEMGGLPVILYSSIITKELRHKGESVKADCQISKPEMHMLSEKAIALIEGR